MPNYNASISMPQMQAFNAGKVGEQYGGYVGNIANAISGAVISDQNKKKIDEYVMAYNNPQDATIFAGLEGSLRTEKLARLLQPLNTDLATNYGKKAEEEKKNEVQIAQNMEVVKARENVPTTTVNPDIDVEAINQEIALIEDALKSQAQIGVMQPMTPSATPAIDQTPVVPPMTPPPYEGMSKIQYPPLEETMSRGVGGIANRYQPMQGYNPPQVPKYPSYNIPVIPQKGNR